MANDRFENKGYVCWLKVCMALLIVKKALENITDTWVKCFHQSLQDKLGCKTCSLCSIEDIKKQWHNPKLKCKQDICHNWLDEIRNLAKGSSIEWSNSDISLLPVGAWECVKLFLPYGCDGVLEAKQADIAALLTLFLNNNFFLKKMGGNVKLVEQARDIRNTAMHSAFMDILELDMQNYFKTLVNLLQCTQTLSSDQECIDAVYEIQKLETAVLEISINKEDEIRALNDRVVAAVTRANQAKHLCTELRKEIEDRKESNINETDVQDLLTKYNKLNTEMQITQSGLEMTKSFFSALLDEHEIDGVDLKHLAEMADRLGKLCNEAPKIKRDIDDLENRMKQCETRLDNQQKEISSIKSTQKHRLDLEVIYDRRKMLKIDKQQCRRDIRDRLLKAYERKHKRIPIYPPKPSLKEPLDRLYVVQSMRVVDHRGKPDRKMLMIENDPELKDTSVDSLNDIFYSEDDPDKKCEVIILSGEAGSGKSTFCEHLLSIWYRSQTNTGEAPSTSSSQYDKEEEFMLKNFSFLFFINLRDAKFNIDESDSEITQILLKTYEFPLSYTDTINDLLGDSNTLVVFDALDESKLRRLPRRNLTHDCIFLTTSRPWKLETIRCEIEEKVDRQIEVKGLEHDATTALAKKVTQVLNEKFKKSKESIVFLKEMSDKSLDKFLKIPVLVMHMICLWFDDKHFGNSQIEIYGKLIHNHVLSDIKTKHVLHSVSSKCEQFPLFCCKKTCQCIKYSDILWKLSELAFDALLDENKENSLVFDHDEMNFHGMVEEEVEICLKVGLLTQHMLYGSITDESKEVSFIHKTHQEYFAAVYLSHSCQNIRQVFNDKMDTLDRVLELEKVLLFVSGMNPKKASLISNLIMERASNDKRVAEYRLSCEWEIQWAPNEELIRRIQTVIFDAVEEALKNKHEIKLTLEDVCVIGKNVYTEENVVTVLHCMEYIDIFHIKSVYIRKPGKENVERLWYFLNASQCLQKLVLYKCFDNAESVLRTVEQNTKSLKTIQLCGTISPRMLKPVLSVPRLQSLGLCNINMEHEVIADLCNCLSTSQQFKEIRILWLTCETHKNYKDQCNYSLNLSNNKELTRLELVSIGTNEVEANFEELTACDVGKLSTNVMVKFIRNLAKAKQLETFGCRGLKDDNEFREYFNTIQMLDNLHEIEIWMMDFGTRNNLQFTQSMNKLETVSIAGAKLTASALSRILKSLPSHTVRVRLGAVGQMDIVDDGTGDIFTCIRHDPNVEKLISDDVQYYEKEREWKIESFVFDYRNDP